MPMAAMCTPAAWAPRSALPSLVQTTKPPVSATAESFYSQTVFGLQPPEAPAPPDAGQVSNLPREEAGYKPAPRPGSLRPGLLVFLLFLGALGYHAERLEEFQRRPEHHLLPRDLDREGLPGRAAHPLNPHPERLASRAAPWPAPEP